jgi:hypothetical protein
MTCCIARSTATYYANINSFTRTQYWRRTGRPSRRWRSRNGTSFASRQGPKFSEVDAEAPRRAAAFLTSLGPTQKMAP